MSAGIPSDTEYLRVRLQNIKTVIRCGIHPWERHTQRPNSVLINVDLFTKLGPGPIAKQKFINYDAIREYILTLPTREHIDLLETIIDDIVEQCFKLEPVESCRISILKEDIFNEADGAGVEAYRTRKSWEGRKD